jgi:hypothetical protein
MPADVLTMIACKSQQQLVFEMQPAAAASLLFPDTAAAVPLQELSQQ